VDFQVQKQRSREWSYQLEVVTTVAFHRHKSHANYPRTAEWGRASDTNITLHFAPSKALYSNATTRYRYRQPAFPLCNYSFLIRGSMNGWNALAVEPDCVKD
jgi:hypothetical protein